LVSATIFLEGGGDSKELHIRCREGFRQLLEKSGLKGRMPRLTACGGRTAAFDDFRTGHATKGDADYVAMLIDSEEPLEELDAVWQHLKRRDGWEAPPDAADEQVLFMTTCMETWIVADQNALSDHYGSRLQNSALPTLNDLESRSRQEVQQKLTHATRNCSNAYAKGKRSFVVLGKLSPTTLKEHLPSFRRVVRILEKEL
jgi:uncharacterized protein DUF4276